MDQSLFPAPHGLSQGITSFIASCCQGIHQTPFSRLICTRKSTGLSLARNPSVLPASNAVLTHAAAGQDPSGTPNPPQRSVVLDLDHHRPASPERPRSPSPLGQTSDADVSLSQRCHLRRPTSDARRQVTTVTWLLVSAARPAVRMVEPRRIELLTS
jgi:hypothetical protein